MSINNRLTIVLLTAGLLLLSGCFSEQGPDESETPVAKASFSKSASSCEQSGCHSGVEPIHPNIDIACTDCHGGDFMAADKENAHIAFTNEAGRPAVDAEGQPVKPERSSVTPPMEFDLDYQQFINPSNLRVVEKTCGKCHEPHVDRVKKNLMAHTAGHHSGGLYNSGVDSSKVPTVGTVAVMDTDGDVPTEKGALSEIAPLISWDNTLDTIISEDDPRFEELKSFANHYKAVPEQACVRCHTWTRGKGYRGAGKDLVKQGKHLNQLDGTYRADGCAACHMEYSNEGYYEGDDESLADKKKGAKNAEKGHPRKHRLTAAVSNDQCIHCHHRGARIGLSFTGRSQMPPDLPDNKAHVKAGTLDDENAIPGVSDVLFNGNNHYVDPETNPADIHGEKGMHCIDCHTQAGVMGDGNIYGHMDQATKIECRTCHGMPGKLANFIDKDGKKLSNIETEQDGSAILTSKVTGKKFTVPQTSVFTDKNSPDFNAKAAAAMNENHLKETNGLECYACHNSWMPNCFGCHFEHDQTKTGTNLLTGEAEDWKASTNNKMFVSLKHFSMGVNGQRKISPFVVGCHPIADATMADGTKVLDYKMPETVNGKSGLAHNPTHNHTVRGKGEVRTCQECHRSPPSLGLGSGNYTFARDYAFAVTDSNIKIYERWSNPSSPKQAATLNTITGGASPNNIATIPNIVSGRTDYLYAAYSGTSGFSVYDFTQGRTTTAATTIKGFNALDISYNARYLYVVEAGVGVRIYDAKTPTAPSLLTTVPIPNAKRAVLWGIHLFVPAGRSGLVIVDVGDHANPKVVQTVDFGMSSNAVDVSLYAHFQKDNQFSSRAYVVDADFGVRVVELSDGFDQASHLAMNDMATTTATGLDTYTRYTIAKNKKEGGDGTPSQEHDYLYVAAGAEGLKIFDITEPNSIKAVATVNKTQLGGDANDIDVVSQPDPPGMDDYAYVATSSGFAVFKVGEDTLITPETPDIKNITTVAAGVTSRLFVEVQQLDRFLDEQGNELKENSHPGSSPLSHDDIVKILRADLN